MKETNLTSDAKFIPVYQPSLFGNEKKYVLDCLESGWISSKGDYVNKFEKNFASTVGVKYATSVCNGTAALHLALLAAGIGEGDEVIVPTFTYIASVNCIKYVGATPVFIDSSKLTWQLNSELLVNVITPKTKAIICVHLYGGMCDMDSIMEVAEKHNLYVIEDCAESIGSQYKGRNAGVFGNIACFSFYGNKTITTGEGGMVLTNNPELINRVTHLKGQGLAHNRQYWHDILGYNYRMTNICSAIGLAQIETLGVTLFKKNKIAEYYRKNLASLPVEFQEAGVNVTSSSWMFSILVQNFEMREAIRDYLSTKLIETRPVFYPVHTMPVYCDQFSHFPVAENIGVRGLNLPSWPDLAIENLDYINSCIHEFFESYKTDIL
jgi:perosamine synthetase